jgi:RND family efflux transporter MFP subunit
MHLFNFFKQTSVSKILVLIVFASLFSAACGGTSTSGNGGNRQQNSNSEDKAEGAPIQVSTTKVVARDVPAFIQSTGSFIADETSDVAPKVAGKVVNVYVNVGEFIGQGSNIAKIDDKDARLQLVEAEASVKQAIAAVRQAEARLGLSPNGTFNASTIPEVRAANANVEQVQAEVRQTEIGIQEAEVNLKQAEVNLRQAEVNEQRYRELVESGDVAMITYEQYRTARDAARAARDVARTARDSARTTRETALTRVNNAKQQLAAIINTARQNNQAIKSAEANVEAARTQVATAQQAVADTVVRAPFAGFVSQRQIAVGEFVTSSNPIITLMKTNPIKIQMKVTEADVPQVGIGRGVSVEVSAFKDRKFAGVVTAINPELDTASRSATVEAQIENSANQLRSGMFGTARINREGGSTGVFVPKSAIYLDQSTQAYRAFVIVENVAKLRVLQLGTEENDTVQILSGLNADELVATSNLEQLYEGARVAF